MEHDANTAMCFSYSKHELTLLLKLKSLRNTQQNVTYGDLECMPRYYTETFRLITLLESQHKFREDKLKNSILLNSSDGGYDINIIIGENGSGKSEFLNSAAKECVESSRNVIAIATSVHDKFDIRSRRFHFFGGRQGRNMVEN